MPSNTRKKNKPSPTVQMTLYNNDAKTSHPKPECDCFEKNNTVAANPAAFIQPFPFKTYEHGRFQGDNDVRVEKNLSCGTFVIHKRAFQTHNSSFPRYPSPSGRSPEQASWLICFSFGMQSAGTYAYPLGNSIFFTDA